MNPAVERVIELDMRLYPLRKEAVRIAAEADILAQAICACADPDCHNRTGDGLTLGRLLVVMRYAWLVANDRETVDRIPPHLNERLNALLLEIGDAFDLWSAIECSCEDPTCGLRAPRSTPTYMKLDVIERAWRVRGGCAHARPAPEEAAVRSKVDRNAQLMADVAVPLAGLDAEAVSRVVGVFRAIRDMRWFRESDEQIAHCIHDHWGADAQDRLQRTPFMAACWSPVMRPGITDQDRQDFLEAANYLGCAIAVHGLAHPIFTHALLAPFVDVLDVSAGLYPAGS